MSNDAPSFTADGAFGTGEVSVRIGVSWVSLEKETWRQLTLSGGKSNGMYGEATTVQPAALRLMPIVKT